MLTEIQKTILAGHIRANTDQLVIDALAGRNDTELTRLYNLDSTFVVWRESVSPDEYRNEMVWTAIDQLTAGRARIWEWITGGMTRNVDATKANVRAGIEEAFGNGDTKDNLLIIIKEFASLAESVFATGTGTDALPGLRTFRGSVTTTDIGRALNDNP